MVSLKCGLVTEGKDMRQRVAGQHSVKPWLVYPMTVDVLVEADNECVLMCDPVRSVGFSHRAVIGQIISEHLDPAATDIMIAPDRVDGDTSVVDGSHNICPSPQARGVAGAIDQISDIQHEVRAFI